MMCIPPAFLLLVTAVCCAAEPQVAILPKEITQSTSLPFAADGSAGRARRDFRIKLRLVPSAEVRLARVTAVEVTEMVIDGGESLSPRCQGGPEHFNKWERDRADYDIDFTLPGISRPVKTLVRLAGTVTVVGLMGNAKRADLMPLKDYLGQAIRLDGVDDHLIIERSQGGLTLRSTGEFFDRLEKTEFLDGMGIEMEAKGWGGNQSEGEHTRTFSIQVPDEGGIRMTLNGKTYERRIPFTISNLPLDSTAPAPSTAKVVKTIDVKPTKGKEE